MSVTEAFKGASMDVVVANGASLCAFGHSLDDNTVLVLSSSDAVVRHAVMSDLGIVAVGVDLRSNYAVFWTSPDGTLWRRVVQHDDALFLVR